MRQKPFVRAKVSAQDGQKPFVSSLVLIAAAIVIDQGTKLAVRQWLPHLVVVNQGSSFSAPVPFAVVAFVTALAGFFYLRSKERPWWASIFLAGALSNLLDRFVWGGAVDWIHYPGGVTGNVADLYLLVGATGFIKTLFH